MVAREAYIKYYKNYFEHFCEPVMNNIPEPKKEKILVTFSMDVEVWAMKDAYHPEIDEMYLEQIVLDNRPYINSTSRGTENYDIRSLKNSIRVMSVRRSTDPTKVFMRVDK